MTMRPNSINHCMTSQFKRACQVQFVTDPKFGLYGNQGYVCSVNCERVL